MEENNQGKNGELSNLGMQQNTVEPGKRSWVATVTKDREAHQQSKPHVLLIEDDKLMREMLAKSLERRGFRVALPDSMSEADIKQALNGFNGRKYDVIITDFRIRPDFSAINILEEIAKDSNPDKQSAKVVLITSDDLKLVEEQLGSLANGVKLVSKLKDPVNTIVNYVQAQQGEVVRR